jgi:hypothetical protein
VSLRGVEVLSQPPLQLGRVVVRPGWLSALQGHPELATLIVQDATVPLPALAAVGASLQKQERLTHGQQASQADSALDTRWWPRRLLLLDVSWVRAGGERHTIDLRADLGADGWPAAAKLDLKAGPLAGARLLLERQPVQGAARQWSVNGNAADGRLAGVLKFESGRDGLRLSGSSTLSGVDVLALTAPKKLLQGRLEGTTTFSALAREPGALADALHSQTRFAVRDAVVLGVDLARAAATVGVSRGGQTRLDLLQGQLRTRGRELVLDDLDARSGVLVARGNVTVAPDQSLAGKVLVSLGATPVGVPLLIGGRLEAPELTLSLGAKIGAAVGTVVLPGVGTGAGANLGDRLGEGLGRLFGRDKPATAPSPGR